MKLVYVSRCWLTSSLVQLTSFLLHLYYCTHSIEPHISPVCFGPEDNYGVIASPFVSSLFISLIFMCMPDLLIFLFLMYLKMHICLLQSDL